MLFSPNKRKIKLSNLKLKNNPMQMVSQTKYLGIIIDDKLDWDTHIRTQVDKCHRLQHKYTQKTKTYFGPRPKLMRWVYTGIIRPKMAYAALVWAHNITPSHNKSLKKLNRLACMSLTPTTRSTPQASLEIMYNIIPLDLHLTEMGLKTYLGIRQQLDIPWDCTKLFPHLGYWHNLKLNTHSLLQLDDRCNIVEWFKQYTVNLDSFKGNKKTLNSL